MQSKLNQPWEKIALSDMHQSWRNMSCMRSYQLSFTFTDGQINRFSILSEHSIIL